VPIEKLDYGLIEFDTRGKPPLGDYYGKHKSLPIGRYGNPDLGEDLVTVSFKDGSRVNFRFELCFRPGPAWQPSATVFEGQGFKEAYVSFLDDT